MTIRCPYCEHGMKLKGAKPGRYKPTCRKCGQTFKLRVRSNPDSPPEIERIAPAAPIGETRLDSEQPAAAATPAASAGEPRGSRSGSTAAADSGPGVRPPAEQSPAADTGATAGDQADATNDPDPHSASDPAHGTVAPSSADETGVWDDAVATHSDPSPARSAEATKQDGGEDAGAVSGGKDVEATGEWTTGTGDADATGEWAGSGEDAGQSPATGDVEATGEWAAGANDADATGEWSGATAHEPTDSGPTNSGPNSGAAATHPERAAQPTIAQRPAQPTRAEAPAAAAAGPGDHRVVPGQVLGGYRIVAELGRGAMGAVYKANQLSLDRNVALKVIQEDLCRNPRFIARFTREAYAAAQLTHHNVVQIYDLDAHRNTHFFSMEMVDGESLADTIDREGKLDAEVAVGYVLQAARGLRYAHDHGMVHRDVKPANLLINREGVVKVADLGLVKTRGDGDSEASQLDAEPVGGTRSGTMAVSAQVTIPNVAMGTPAFMAPEQAESAADVDQRADIYSLGCTLYVLLTGRPPFEGASALEVITKHKTEAVVRPEVLVRRIPQALSDITLRMVARELDQRYADLDEVIRDLEGFLGISSTTTFSPREEHVQQLESCVEKFQKSSTARLRPTLILGFFALCAVVLVFGLVLGRWTVAAGALGLGGLTTAIYFVVSGWLERTYLMDKVREFVFSSRWTDYLTWAAGTLLFLVAILVFQLLIPGVIVAVLSVGFAFGLYFLIDRRIQSERREATDAMYELLKTLRLRGLEEDAVRQFVSKYAGDRWEEFFEVLFGYQAKLEARQAWERSGQGKRRPRYRAWRDPLIRWIDTRVNARREAKERKHLEKVEVAELEAEGVSAQDAKQQAATRAAAMVEQAAQVHATLAAANLETNPQVAAARKRERIKAMLEAARSGKSEGAKPVKQSSALLGWLLWPFGAQVRFLVGAMLVAGCVLWINQNGFLSTQDLQAAGDAIGSADVGSAGEVAGELLKAGKSKPLELPLVPAMLTGIFRNFNPGVAGLLLMLSAFFRGYRICFFIIPAAVIILFGHALGVPAVLASAETISMAIGSAVAVLGFFFGRAPTAAPDAR